MSTSNLSPLPPRHSIPTNDQAWETRELKFHEENVKQINDLVRRMNAQAPAIVRRPLITREQELAKIRGVLRDEVWEEITRRAHEAAIRPQQESLKPLVPSFLFGPEEISRFKTATRRSLSTIAAPVAAVIGKSRVGGVTEIKDTSSWTSTDQGPSASRNGEPARYGLYLVGGLGVAGIVLLRQPAQNDSHADLEAFLPLHDDAVSHTSSSLPVLALSPAETHMTPFEVVRIYVIEPVATFFRFIHLAILFGPVIITSPMIFIGSTQKRKRLGRPLTEEENWGAVWWYGFLVRQMERAGPSFIKLGQWAASRADLFPAMLCDKMGKLHSNGKPHSLAHTKRVIEKAFGLSFADIFDEFGNEPIGCGAIAQVYKARLKPALLGTSTRKPAEHHLIADHDADEEPSTSVAIKVLHPRVHKTIRRDIAVMSTFANLINLFPGMQWFSLPEEVDVFGEMMNSQLDLRVEAANLDRFGVNFRKRGRRITFPKPIRLSQGLMGKGGEESQEVMMEEFEDALPLKWFLRNGGGPYDDKIASIGLDGFLEMLLLDNWTHGDLHPGNIMVRFYRPSTRDYIGPLLSRFSKPNMSTEDPIPTHSVSADELVHTLSVLAHDQQAWQAKLEDLNEKGYEPQLIFIDAGLVTSLDTTNRKNFLDLFQAIAEFDGYKAGKLMIERCRTPEYAIDEETFALKMQHIVLSVKSKTFSLAKIKISDILTDVLTAVRQHHVKMEGDFVNTVISILLLEGIGRQMDPNMDLFKSALPILRQLGRQLGTREAISAVPKGNIWAMAKLWVWMEAREVAGEVSAIDEWMKYDRFAPSV